jgi:hypothetical protein
MLVDPVERGRLAEPAVAPAQSAPVMRKVELPGLAGREVDGEHLLVVERVHPIDPPPRRPDLHPDPSTRDGHLVR